MAQFYNAGLSFDSKATDTKKIFTIKFPIDALLTLRWEEDELKKLQELDKSESVADQLEMLSMIARKIESTDSEHIIKL